MAAARVSLLTTVASGNGAPCLRVERKNFKNTAEERGEKEEEKRRRRRKHTFNDLWLGIFNGVQNVWNLFISRKRKF